MTTETADAASMMDKYLQNHRNSLDSTASYDSDNDENGKKKEKKRKNAFGNLIKHKKDKLADVTNSINNTSTPSPSKKKSKLKTATPEWRDETHSLVSPSKELLSEKKRRELKREVVLLTERVNCMEDNQIAHTKYIDELQEKLASTTKQLEEVGNERNHLKKENEDLKRQLSEVKSDLDRHVTARWKSFVSSQAYIPGVPPASSFSD